MANEIQKFSNNDKVKMIATAVYALTPYLKKAHSYIPASQMEGKKYGNKYSVYIPDPGKTRIGSASEGRTGLQAQYDAIQEVEYPILCDAAFNDIQIDEWEKLGDIEDWKKQIAIPHGQSVARTVEQHAINKTVFQASQAVVGKAGLEVLSDAQGALDMTGAVGNKVTFINPTVGTKIAAKALGAFNNPDIAKDLYRENWLGKYGASTIVTESYMPTIVANSARTASVTLVPVSTNGEVVGFEPIKKVTGTAKKGDMFKVEGLKLVDKNGVQVDQDYMIIVADDNGNIPELRIEIEGKSCGNANAWVAAGTDSLTLTYGLENGKKYAVTQCRIEGAVAFDSYKFGKIPGTTLTEDKFDDGAITVQVYEGGDIDTLTSAVRCVVPFAVGLPDPRESVVAYIEM
jgi:hypothetical protein